MLRKIKLGEAERERLVADLDPDFPTDTTQILNTANQNSQGPRPKAVGQMSELTEEFKEEYPDGDYEDWKQFHYEEWTGEERIEEVTERIHDIVVKMRDAAEEMVRRWVKDLFLYKTYTGLGRNEEDIQETLRGVRP